MAVPSDGSYGIEEGIICGQPCHCTDGAYSIVEGLEVNDFSRERILRLGRRAALGARDGRGYGSGLSG